jgi:hypothetical protein
MKTCYAISSGSYSDYQVHAIFTTRELAEAQLPSYESGDIEEFPLDPIVPDQYAGLVGFDCAERYNLSVWATMVYPAEMVHRNDAGLIHKSKKGFYRMHLWASDKDHAIKVAAEKFAHQRAIDAGITI